jgi:hypothetical protein
MGLSLFEGRVFLLNISLVLIKYRILWKRIVASLNTTGEHPIVALWVNEIR